MRYYLKVVFIIIVIVAILLLSFFTIDFIQVQRKEHPLFCKRVTEYWDGGSYECYGAFYKVNTYTDVQGNIEKMEIVFHSMKFIKEK